MCDLYLKECTKDSELMNPTSIGFFTFPISAICLRLIQNKQGELKLSFNYFCKVILFLVSRVSDFNIFPKLFH